MVFPPLPSSRHSKAHSSTQPLVPYVSVSSWTVSQLLYEWLWTMYQGVHIPKLLLSAHLGRHLYSFNLYPDSQGKTIYMTRSPKSCWWCQMGRSNLSPREYGKEGHWAKKCSNPQLYLKPCPECNQKAHWKLDFPTFSWKDITSKKPP